MPLSGERDGLLLGKANADVARHIWRIVLANIMLANWGVNDVLLCLLRMRENSKYRNHSTYIYIGWPWFRCSDFPDGKDTALDRPTGLSEMILQFTTPVVILNL